jgi:outer membrane protein TolC
MALLGSGLAAAQVGRPILSVSENPPEEVAPAEQVAGREPEAPRTFRFPTEPILKQAGPANIVEDLTRSPAVVPAAEQEAVLDLSTALRLAERDNPAIAIGRQAIQEALALQLQARALVLPHLRAGANYHVHNGVLQASSGLMRQVDLQSVYVGAGSRALGADTLAFPGVQFISQLGDAWFEPLAARQEVAASQARAGAIANTVLLEVAVRFLDLMTAEGQLAALRQSEEEANRIVQTTALFLKQNAGKDADARRARTEALLLHVQTQRAEEQSAVAAAELARVLHLDPAVRLRTPGRAIALLPLVDAGLTLEQLLPIAQNARPELAAARAEIARRETQVRQERLRPLFPTVSIGYSAGGFGGGSNRVNTPFNSLPARSDFDVIAYWTLQNAGAGNRALVNRRQAERGIAMVEQVRLINQVRREVAVALALTQARRRDVDIAQQRLAAAEKGFREDYTRMRGNLALPIEVTNSMDRLVQARLSFIRVLADYNRAQFQLFVAVGQSPLAASVPEAAKE